MRELGVSLAVLAFCAVSASAHAQDADAKARQIESQMTDEERLSILHGVMALPLSPNESTAHMGGLLGAGYIPGVPRLGVPALHETDASLGVTNPLNVRPGDTATALPGGLALGSTFNPELARSAGAVAGGEARSKGFNVLLGGGMNLVRDPRNGRNFEYLSEDPLLSGVLAGEAVIGAQSQRVVSTVKHFALNSNETNRMTFDAVIDQSALRESDLLAFEIAIERGNPGSVMCAYNKVNSEYACGNNYLLNDVLKGAWGYKGWVMADWGATHDVSYAAKGLDQQSGQQLDKQVWFDKPLKAALDENRISRERVSDMVRRILRSVYTVGADNPEKTPVDAAKNTQVALDVARQGIVLLKNDGALPLASSAKTIAVIGGRANIGVLSGGGSSQVTPNGGYAASVPLGGEGVMAAWRIERYNGPAPLEELKKLLPNSKISYDAGVYTADAAALARRSDLAIVFVTKHELEGYDSPDLSLPAGQDAVIAAVAAANPNTIVVLETGNPIAMPWAPNVKAIVSAWYSGQRGGQAIAEVLTGAVNPSGRLPVTFPASLADHPRPELPGFGTPEGTPTTANMTEGSDVGYRWYAKTGKKPLFAFGHGLSYTSFQYSNLSVRGGETITATFTVRNTGGREGADVPQLYLTDAAGKKGQRLIGFQRVSLKPGQSRRVTVTADPRLLASYDGAAKQWRIAGGQYSVALARAADQAGATASVALTPRLFGK